MKIRFEKELTVINVVEKVSISKGNKYGQMVAFDREGNYHTIYIKGDFVQDLLCLEFKQDVTAILEVTYKDKYDKVELLGIA